MSHFLPGESQCHSMLVSERTCCCWACNPRRSYGCWRARCAGMGSHISPAIKANSTAVVLLRDGACCNRVVRAFCVYADGADLMLPGAQAEALPQLPAGSVSREHP